MNRWSLGVALLAVFFFNGCRDTAEQTIELYSITAAPPARTGTVTSDDDKHSVELSRGIVLGVACWDSCDGGCADVQFAVADPAVVSVRPVFSQAGGTASFALVSGSAGATNLTVHNKCASQTYAVVVSEPTP